MGRPAATTPRNGPTAHGDKLALDNQLIQNPPDDAAQLLPTLGSNPYRTGDTGPTASFLAVGSFFPKLDHLAHVNHSRNLATRNSENGTGGVCGDGQSVHGERSFVSS